MNVDLFQLVATLGIFLSPLYTLEIYNTKKTVQHESILTNGLKSKMDQISERLNSLEKKVRSVS